MVKPSSPTPHRILLVDDNEAQLKHSGKLLEEAGATLQTLPDPQQTLEVAHGFFPDVIVIAQELENCSGLELAIQLREAEGFQSPPILLLTPANSNKPSINIQGNQRLTLSVTHEELVKTVLDQAARSRKKQQQAAQREEGFRQLQLQLQAFDQHALICITDAKGIITLVNNNFCQACGYTEEELVGQSTRVLKSGHHPQVYYETMWQTIAQGITWHGQLYNQKKDGSGYWLEYTIAPCLDANNKPYQYVAIGTNISGLKSAQAALQESAERLRLSQEFAGIGTWDWDIEQGLVYWSSNTGPLFGLEAEARTTQFEDSFKAVHPLDRKLVDETVNACLDSQQPFNCEYRIIWPDGSIRWVHTHGNIFNEDGKGSRWLGVIRDITRGKETEQALIQAKEAAEAASQAKSEFLSHMSHELRTPLNIILGFNQLLEIDPEISSDQQESLSEINKAGKHLLNLINRVLDLSKIESGHDQPNLTTVECHEPIQECVDLIQPLAEERDIQLQYFPAEFQHTQAIVDPIRLRQALLNLLSNAVKYNIDGGKIKVTLEQMPEERIRIHIEDTGPGIPKEQRSKLFQPFSRLNPSNNSEDGTGIGLVISKKLLNNMGGDIDFDSTPGQGSRFWIELPQSPVEQATSDLKPGNSKGHQE